MFDFLYKTSIRTKIYVGFIALLLPVFVYEIIQKTSESDYEQKSELLYHLFTIQDNIKQLEIKSLTNLKEFTNLLSASNINEIQNSLQKHEELSKEVNWVIDSTLVLFDLNIWPIDLRSDINDFRKNMEDVKKSSTALVRIFEDSFRLKLLSLYDSQNANFNDSLLTDSIFLDISINEIKTFENRLRKLDHDFYAESEHLIAVSEKIIDSSMLIRSVLSEQITAINKFAYFKFILLLLTLIVLPWPIAGYLATHFNSIVGNIKEFSAELSKGTVFNKRHLFSGGEYGEIQQNLEQINTDYNKLQELSKSVIQGDYNNITFPFPENSHLGDSVRSMLESLRDVSNEREKQQLRDKLQNWHTEGMAKFSDILRQYASDTTLLANELIISLTNYVNAVQGALFIAEVNNDGQTQLRMLTAYAYERVRHVNKTVNLGEGLIGSCAIEKKTIYLEEIPKDFVKIRSGLGGANPRSLLIVPLKIDERIHGILELASFEKFKPHEITLIESLAENIASSLSLAESNTRTTKLLGETKNQAEELASQEEEMRQNLEEMQATREEALRRERELSILLQAVDQTVIRAEFDLKGKLLSASDMYYSFFESSAELQKSQTFFSQLALDVSEPFQEIWRYVCDGFAHKGDFKFNKSNGNLAWVTGSLTPITIESNKINRILFLGTDNTEKLLLEQETRTKSEQIRAQEEEIERSFDIMMAGQEETDKVLKETTTKLNESDRALLMLKEILNMQPAAFAGFNAENELVYANNVFEKQTDYYVNSLKTCLLTEIIKGKDLENLKKKKSITVDITCASGKTKKSTIELTELATDSQKLTVVRIDFI
ncbi:MAG TPA: hypothetical protein DCQ31_06975 [Bacteroidales bacterium]|nr:hypothetical protein [Bacteroidales bacterium]